MRGKGKSTRPLSVLVVDDDAAICGFLPRVFARFDYSSAVADSGKEAIALLEEQAFDIALIDFMMPNMNGLELSRWLADHHPNTAIVIMTGYGSEPELKEALEGGVFRCIPKPLPDLEELRAELEDAIESKQPPSAT